MTALLIEGITEAYRNLGAALRLFWPLATLLVLSELINLFYGDVKYTVQFDSEPLAATAIVIGGFGLFIYLFLLLCQGAVGWHRRLLLHEHPKWMSLIISRRSLKYALPAVVFVLIMLVGFFLALLTIQPYGVQLIQTAYRELSIAGSPTIEQLEALRRAMIPLTVVNFFATVAVVSAVLWFGQSWLLVFPHISVRNSQPAWGKINGRVARFPQLVGALLIVYFSPSILGLLYAIAMPVSVQLIPAVSIAVKLVYLVLSILCFLWGLSVLSIAYRTVVADKVPYKGTGDAATA